MIIKDILEKAAEMEVPATSALLARSRYLKQQMKEQHEIINAYAEYEGKPDDEALAVHLAWKANDEFMAMARELRQVCREISGIMAEQKGEITDEMISKAREYPVKWLIDFRHNKATAWCHEDKNPSLTFMSRTKKAWCPVCDKYFDAIKVLMERDGMSFREAVKQLAN